MKTWTVQCGYAAYYANTVVVEAETLDAALEKAIEQANDDPCWKALDHCGPTFVDAVAEGVDADPWQGLASAIPVPDRFAEAGEPPLVTVVVRGGTVQDVAVTGGRVRVHVRDHDIEGGDPAGPEFDEGAAASARADRSPELPPGPADPERR